MKAWRNLIFAERFGSFVKIWENEFFKTAQIGSSVDVLSYRKGYCSTEVSHRFREVLYRRIESNDRQGIVLWKNDETFGSNWYKWVYYLPFHRCFIGYSSESNTTYLFSDDVFFEEECECVFVLGNFLFFSRDGKLFGLYDSKHQRIIEPFFEIYDQPVTLTHSWTDEYYPVKIEDHYYLVDPHGNCFCKHRDPIYKCSNLFATKADSWTICFGLNSNKEICMLPGAFSAKYAEKKLLVRQREGYLWEDIDAYGNIWKNIGFCQAGYYGEATKVSEHLTTYSRQPMKLNGYKFTGERLLDCFWKISYKEEDCRERYGIFNEETNEIITEPMYDYVRVSDRGIECIYGSMIYFLDHFGKPISVVQNESK